MRKPRRVCFLTLLIVGGLSVCSAQPSPLEAQGPIATRDISRANDFELTAPTARKAVTFPDIPVEGALVAELADSLASFESKDCKGETCLAISVIVQEQRPIKQSVAILAPAAKSTYTIKVTQVSASGGEELLAKGSLKLSNRSGIFIKLVPSSKLRGTEVRFSVQPKSGPKFKAGSSVTIFAGLS